MTPAASKSVAATLAVALLAASTASAQNRPDSLTMTCDSVQALLKRERAAVIGTGPNVFGRYVADGRACSVTQFARQAFIATKDNKYCLVYNCSERSFYWGT
jgi:hypothetical protein